MQMTFILIYWLGNLQALLAQTAQALPFLILMTLLASRKGNAALCLWGGRQLLRLDLSCAALSLPLFPLMLLLETLRQPQMPPLADLLVQPAGVALLAWLPATLLLWGLLRASRHWPDATDPAITAYRTTDLRLTLWGCLLALLLFLLGSLLSTGLLLEPPQGMERSNFILLQIRQALHLLFRYLSLAGGAALLWLWYLRHRAPLTDERAFTLAVRWCAVWAVVGYLPSIIDFWSTLLAALLRSLHSGVPFDIMPQMNALILSVLAALAIISWSVFLYRPRKARNLVLQLLPWCFLFIRMAVPLTQLPRP